MTALTPTEYQRRALKTARHMNRSEMLLNAVLGLTGEAGEIADHYKKAVFHGHELDELKLEMELGDVLWYVSLMATALGVSLTEVMQVNLDKLQRRYGEQFSEAASINRKD